MNTLSKTEKSAQMKVICTDLLAEGKTYNQITEKINGMGFRNTKGAQYTKGAIAVFINYWRLNRRAYKNKVKAATAITGVKPIVLEVLKSNLSAEFKVELIQNLI